MNILRITIATAVVGILLSGCANTIRGVGQDAANTVDATQGAVKKVDKAAQ